MCISLRLKANLCWRHIFRQTDLCAQAQFNATVCQFTDIISLRRRHILLGPSELGVKCKFWLLFKNIEDNLISITYGGIRALTIYQTLHHLPMG